MRNKWGKFVLIIGLMLCVSPVAIAQETATQGPTGADKARAAAQASGEAERMAESEAAAARAQFEREFGAPTDAFPKYEPQQLQIEKPGKVPDDVRKYVTDAEIIPIYCAMAKWKTGQFFSAMKVLKSELAPKLEKAKTALGVTMNTPDFDSLTAEGQNRLDSICNAKTIDEADRISQDFVTWGQEFEKREIAPFIMAIDSKVESKSEEIKQKIEQAIQPLIDEETNKVRPELEAEAKSIAESFNLDHQPSPAELLSLKSRVEEQLRPKIEAKKQEAQRKIESKVEELKKQEAGDLLELQDMFDGIQPKLMSAIDAGLGEYDKYKTEAFQLRKDLVIKIIDKNIESAIEKLNASEKDIEMAKKDDPSIKSVSEIKAELEKDKESLIKELDATLDSGDETAFQNAINNFKSKWENIRAEGEKLAEQSVSKICTTALNKFQEGRSQIEKNRSKLGDLTRKCSNSTTDECLKVNEFSARFQTLNSKMDDILSGMNLAENMCKDEGSADIGTMVALMRKIQADGEDLKTFGAALEAEKSTAIADSVGKICQIVLPQLDAYEKEIDQNGLALLRANIRKCSGVKTPECDIINSTKSDYDSFNTDVRRFQVKRIEIQSFCKRPKEQDFERIQTMLSVFKEDGEALKERGDKIKQEQAETISERAICKAVMPQIERSKAQISTGVKKISDTQNGCAGKKDEKCVAISKLQPKFNEIKSKTDSILETFTNLKNTCDAAKPSKPSDSFLKAVELTGSKQQADEIAKLVKELEKAQADASLFDKRGVKIEAEDEIATKLLPKTADWHSREETNPSWRPPYFGTGVWYLSRGDESLTYRFNLSMSTNYNIWVRDYVDNFQKQGVRKVVYYVNGNKITTAPEVTLAELSKAGVRMDPAKGAFAWHKIAGPIRLSGGSNTLRVVKESTTPGAAILDAFYFTSGDDVPPER